MDAFHFRSLLLATIFNHSECCIPLSSSLILWLHASTHIYSFLIFNFPRIFIGLCTRSTPPSSIVHLLDISNCVEMHLIRSIVFYFRFLCDFKKSLLKLIQWVYFCCCCFLFEHCELSVVYIQNWISFSVEWKKWRKRRKRPRRGKVKCAQKSSLTNVHHFSTFSRIELNGKSKRIQQRLQYWHIESQRV